MSIELENTSKTVDVIREERTWRTEIFTEKNTDYNLKIHREIVESQDGVALAPDRESLEVPQLAVKMDDVVASTEIISYKDKDGTDKTIPMSDIPFIIPEGIEILIAAEKARLAE